MNTLADEMESLDIVQPDLEFPRPLKRSFSSFPSSPKRPRITRSCKVDYNSTATHMDQESTLNPTPCKRKHLDTEDEIRKFYLDKKVKVARKNLETIYEKPVKKKGNLTMIGYAQIKRSLYLNREYKIINKHKAKLRNAKVKRLGKKGKAVKMSDEEFQQKMSMIDIFLTDKNENCDGTDKPAKDLNSSDSI